MDRLDSLRAFVLVVQSGGFSRAARRMAVSPAMVTKTSRCSRRAWGRACSIAPRAR